MVKMEMLMILEYLNLKAILKNNKTKKMSDGILQKQRLKMKKESLMGLLIMSGHQHSQILKHKKIEMKRWKTKMLDGILLLLRSLMKEKFPIKHKTISGPQHFLMHRKIRMKRCKIKMLDGIPPQLKLLMKERFQIRLKITDGHQPSLMLRKIEMRRWRTKTLVGILQQPKSLTKERFQIRHKIIDGPQLSQMPKKTKMNK